MNAVPKPAPFEGRELRGGGEPAESVPRAFTTVLTISAIVTLACGLASATEKPTSGDDKLRAAESLEMCTARTRTYNFRLIDGQAEMTLRPEPILKWTQPVYGTVFGYVYVWTYKGRPEVVSSFLKWYQPFQHVTDEFHSLSTGGIVADRDGATCWTSEKPGVEPKLIPDAPEPASTSATRLRQLRELAQGFSGRETDRQREERDMRLLPQPIYRYEPPEGDVVDGALFAFGHGTDPDAILVIEARKVEGKSRWHYALIRMTTSALRVSLKGQKVWDVPLLNYGVVYSHREPYTSFRFEDARSIPPKRADKP